MLFHVSAWRTAALKRSRMGYSPGSSNTAMKRPFSNFIRHFGCLSKSVSATLPESKFDRAAFRIFHARRRGESEGHRLIADLAGEFEVRERDAARFRIAGGDLQRQRVARALEAKRQRLVIVASTAARKTSGKIFLLDRADARRIRPPSRSTAASGSMRT